MKELVEEFLKKYADVVYDMPDHALELLMDDHICIEWENEQYFVPKNNSSYTADDDLMYEFLDTCYKL